MGQEEQKSNHQFRLEEWKSLREEISRNQDYVQKIFYWTVTLSIGIYSIGLQKASILSAIIVMLPTIYANFSYYWILTRLYSSKRITKYIKEHLEKHDELYWETNLSEFKIRCSDRSALPPNADIFSLLRSLHIFSPFLCTMILFSLESTGLKVEDSIVWVFLVTPSIVSLVFYILFNKSLIQKVKSAQSNMENIKFH